MYKNQNIIDTTLESASRIGIRTGAQLGMVLMAAAAFSGLVEMPNHEANKFVLPAQAAVVMNENTANTENPLRREKEETAPHFISYGVNQRTPARSSK